MTKNNKIKKNKQINNKPRPTKKIRAPTTNKNPQGKLHKKEPHTNTTPPTDAPAIPPRPPPRKSLMNPTQADVQPKENVCSFF